MKIVFLMATTKFIIDQLKRVSTFLGVFLLTLYGCASQTPQLNASQYRFKFNDEAYRMRSIFLGDKKESYNELIGENFVAVDFDQDRILDRILLGDVTLNEAQKIYNYGLDRIAKENKLIVRAPRDNRYLHESNGFEIEIRSFRPANAHPFNEFKIMDKRPAACPEDIIVVDQNADGTLDEVLKGSATLKEVQSQYAEAIEAGLQKGALARINGTILVKEK